MFRLYVLFREGLYLVPQHSLARRECWFNASAEETEKYAPQLRSSTHIVFILLISHQDTKCNVHTQREEPLKPFTIQASFYQVMQEKEKILVASFDVFSFRYLYFCFHPLIFISFLHASCHQNAFSCDRFLTISKFISPSFASMQKKFFSNLVANNILLLYQTNRH